jgi:predicted DNA-binding protein (MmcQ/YjbR family)
VRPAALRRLCLGFPGAEETFPFSPGVSVFKVGGRMFALTKLEEDPLRLSLKCEPDLAADLRRTYPAIAPGYHLPKRHWNTLTLDGSLDAGFVRQLVEDSYDLVVDALPRKTRDALA